MASALLVGRTHHILDGAQEQLGICGLRLEAATNAAEVKLAVSRTTFDHVFMGAGIDLEERLAIVRAVYEASETTTLHLKDVASGPEGFLPFTRAILTSLLHDTPTPK